MQFFFHGLLVAAITYFLKLGHNNHGLIFTVVTLGLLRAVEIVGLLRAVETVGLLRAVETMGLLRAVSSMGLIWAGRSIDQTWANNRPHYGRTRARVGIVRSWANHNGPSLIGRI